MYVYVRSNNLENGVEILDGESNVLDSVPVLDDVAAEFRVARVQRAFEDVDDLVLDEKKERQNRQSKKKKETGSV